MWSDSDWRPEEGLLGVVGPKPKADEGAFFFGTTSVHLHVARGCGYTLKHIARAVPVPARYATESDKAKIRRR